MAEPKKIAFNLVDFLANAGLGRRIVQLKPKQAFFSQGSRCVPIPEHLRPLNCEEWPNISTNGSMRT